MTEPERAAALKSVQLELFQLRAQVLSFERKRRALQRRLKEIIHASGMGTKVCRRCHVEMAVEQFYKDLQKSDGRDSYCIECRGLLNKISRCLKAGTVKRKGNVKAGRAA